MRHVDGERPILAEELLCFFFGDFDLPSGAMHEQRAQVHVGSLLDSRNNSLPRRLNVITPRAQSTGEAPVRHASPIA